MVNPSTGRASLLESIRQAGGIGKANLRSVKERKLEKKKQKEQEQGAEALWQNCFSLPSGSRGRWASQGHSELTKHFCSQADVGLRCSPCSQSSVNLLNATGQKGICLRACGEVSHVMHRTRHTNETLGAKWDRAEPV